MKELSVLTQGKLRNMNFVNRAGCPWYIPSSGNIQRTNVFFLQGYRILQKKLTNRENGNEIPESVSGLLGGIFPLPTSLHCQEQH